jgi:hypothetical protein
MVRHERSITGCYINVDLTVRVVLTAACNLAYIAFLFAINDCNSPLGKFIDATVLRE